MLAGVGHADITQAGHLSYESLLRRPVPVDSLVAFRILFGLLLAGMMIRTLAKGWVETMYLQPGFHFTYPGFGWVQPGPAWVMYPLVVGLALCGFAIAAGFFYRIAATLFFIGFVYLELIDRAFYLNHYYLVSLLSLLLIFLPLHRKFSWDARAGRVNLQAHVPAWMPWLLRFQLAVVYVFAAIAKMNHDWLFLAQPLRIWLPAASDLAVIGPWLNELWVAYAFSWFGMFYDLLIVFALLHSRTRPFAYATVIVFHTMTWLLFPIGTFPWIMIVATTVFFTPDWPCRIFGLASSSLQNQTRSQPNWRDELASPPFKWRRPTAIALSIYCLLQILIPTRSWFIPGNSYWTGEGFDFGWRMMVAEKTGYVEFYEVDQATGSRRRMKTDSFLQCRQEQMMSHSPEMIRQFARALRQQSGKPIHVEAFATLNGRRAQPIIRSDIDLSADELPDDWIIPLRKKEPLQTASR